MIKEGAVTVRVRTATPEEFGEIGALTLAAYQESGQLATETGYEPVLLDVASRASAGTVLVAVDEGSGRPVGAVTLVLAGSRYAELAGPGEAELRMLAVDPSAQGRGVARLLVAQCLRRAADLGCSAVVICYRDFVTAAQRLYTGLGFTRVPELDWSPVPGVNLLAMRVGLPAPEAPAAQAGAAGPSGRARG
jgi:ribosomal protein S18 acetylase RimI-like enzyme